MPITIPAGVTVTVADGNVVTVKGPKGELVRSFPAQIGINIDGTSSPAPVPMMPRRTVPSTALPAPISTTWWWA